MANQGFGSPQSIPGTPPWQMQLFLAEASASQVRCFPRCACQSMPAALLSLPLLPAFIYLLSSQPCCDRLPASFHCLPALIALFQFSFPAPASVHTHPLFGGPSLSRGETYWLRHSGKPRASFACTPARFQLYLHPLHYLPPSTNAAQLTPRRHYPS